MPAQSHVSDPKILSRRSLNKDHRRLAELLQPGLSVLDLGCGTGAITAGIAAAVGSEGRVLGLDRDGGLLELARREHGGIPNLRFECGDATDFASEAVFDIVSAARTLQWISDPAVAIRNMARAAKPGGLLVVLDYNHTRNSWLPEPPAEFQHFYNAFLGWRAANGWNNEMADALPELFRSEGLLDVESVTQDEVTQRGEADFEHRSTLWSEVMESLGQRVIESRYCTPDELTAARTRYNAWARNDLIRQTLVLRAVTGRVPAHTA